MFPPVLSLFSPGQSFSDEPGNLTISGRVKDSNKRCERTELKQKSREMDWLGIIENRIKMGN